MGQAGDIERVLLVLGSPVIYRPLPFDEPFYLTGRSGALIDTVTAWLVATPDREIDCTTVPPDAALSSWRRIDGVPADSFYVRMTELPPNRSFGLCVRTSGRPPEARLAELRTAWRAAIDSSFRAHSSAGRARLKPWTPDASELRAFQSVLQARIGNDVVARPGSLLDRSLGPDGFARGLPDIVRVAAAQYERDLAIADLAVSAASASEALARIKTHPALPRLVAVRTAANSRLRAFHSANRAGLQAAAYIDLRTATQLEYVADGEAVLVSENAGALASRVPLTAVWDAADLEPRGRSLSETIEQVSALFAAIRSLGTSPELRDLAYITADEIDEMEAEASLALGELASVQNHLFVIGTELSKRSRALADAVDRLVTVEHMTLAVETHTHYDVKTTASNHISADFGALYLWDAEEVTPVLGANFYFRPVNRDRGPGGHPFRRLSFSVGLTTSSLKREGERDDLFGSFNVAVGVGVRLTRLLRVSAGGVAVKGIDPDPDNERTSILITPYAALTLDFVVKDLLSNLFGKIF